MPKRSYRESDEERWERKMKEYEAKLAKRRRRRCRTLYSTDEAEGLYDEEHLNYVGPARESQEADLINQNEIGEQLSSRQASPEQPNPEQPSSGLGASADVSIPSASVPQAPEPDPPTQDLDPVLIQALGDCHTDVPEWGDDLLQDISQRWEPIFKTGLTKDVKDELLKKYLFPKNSPSTKPPVLNPELTAMLTEAARNRDNRLYAKQGQLGTVIAALGKAMTGIVSKNMETAEILRILSDAGKLLVDSHYLETDTRRSLITPLLEKSYVDPIKNRKRDSFLFGDNLADFIKTSRGAKKTGQLIAPTPSTSSTNLNWRGPPRQQQQRVNRFQGYRNIGQRRAPPQRAPRRAPLPPPPPAPRRAPPPTAGPSRRPAPQSAYRPRNAA